jgi:glutamine amidotransferase
MQILFTHSQEEDADCLGWLEGKVVKFDAQCVRVPQMGWNEVRFTPEREAPESTLDGYFYFVNSYYAVPGDEGDIWGRADYGGLFAAAVRRENIFGTQFHAEKSGKAGLALLNGFLSQEGGA